MTANIVAKRISDRRVLKLIRKWLKAGVIEQGQYSPTEKGTPQGGVISPLLANIYLHVLDRYWALECSHLGKLVRYCDDFVIICRGQSQARAALDEVRSILDRLKLRLHPDKTRIVRTDEEGFDFLGYHFRKCKARQNSWMAPLAWPGKKAMNHVRAQVKDLTRKTWKRLPLDSVVRMLNGVIRGWRNYFEFGNGTRRLLSLDNYVLIRLWKFYSCCLGHNAKAKYARFQNWVKQCGIEHFYRPGIAVALRARRG